MPSMCRTRSSSSRCACEITRTADEIDEIPSSWHACHETKLTRQRRGRYATEKLTRNLGVDIDTESEQNRRQIEGKLTRIN
eukprot:4850749-Pleurochrysis_carterae.AAC.2